MAGVTRKQLAKREETFETLETLGSLEALETLETLETLDTFPNGRRHKETTCKVRRDIRGKNKQRN